jgi:hypothetical protein
MWENIEFRTRNVEFRSEDVQLNHGATRAGPSVRRSDFCVRYSLFDILRFSLRESRITGRSEATPRSDFQQQGTGATEAITLLCFLRLLLFEKMHAGCANADCLQYGEPGQSGRTLVGVRGTSSAYRLNQTTDRRSSGRPPAIGQSARQQKPQILSPPRIKNDMCYGRAREQVADLAERRERAVDLV